MTPTARSQVRRKPTRGSNDDAAVHAVLDAALLAHVGFSVDGQPFVIPTLFGREGNTLYLHGSSASRMMRLLETGVSACVTVAIIDGLVLARSAMHHSMNYRSVVVFGTAKKIEDRDRKLHALEVITEHIIKGRWAEARIPNDQELKATTVLELTMDEASAKVRTGGPIDDEEDYSLPVWAGVLPMTLTTGTPLPDDRLVGDPALPAYVSGYRR